jgi:tetratricopeptide (TPR) repeat protein
MVDGGYLGWKLYPDYRPMIDGRLEIFGAERFASLFCSPPQRFQKLDRQYAFGSVLIHHSHDRWQALGIWLSQSSDWELRFVDDTAAVFVRASGAPQERKKPVELGYPARPGEANGDEVRMLTARVDVLSGLGEHGLALAQLDRAARLDPDLANVSINRAVLTIKSGDFSAATEHLERALLDDPDDPILRVTIAGIYRNHGRVSRADALLRTALELDPELEGRLKSSTSPPREGSRTGRLRDLVARLGAPISALLGCGLTLVLLIYQKRDLGV